MRLFGRIFRGIGAWTASAFLFLFFPGCAQDGRVGSSAYQLLLRSLLDHSVEEVSVQEAGKAGAAIFLDARALSEYQVSHIPGAVWVGYDDFTFDRLNGIAFSDSLIVYCSVGYRSEKVAEKLVEAGFGQVQNLYGGIFEWKNQQGAVVDSSGQSTERVHAYDRTWGRWLRAGEKVYE